MRRMIGIAAAGVALLMLYTTIADARLCDHLPMRCKYEAPAFTMTVVDAATGQPLVDVHALAEWQLFGLHGSNGPIMVLDAVSGPDGKLRFPGWGPVSGPNSGLVSPNDPVVTLFKSRYRAVVILNNQGFTEQIDPTERVRRFGRDGQTFQMEDFSGSPAEWIQELKKVYLGLAAPMSEERRFKFREPYANRLRRIWLEREKLPVELQGRARFFADVEGTLKFLEGTSR